MATWEYNETRNGHFTEFYVEGRIDAADLTDADTSQDIAVSFWPANAFKRHAQVMIAQDFEDATPSLLTNMAVTIGDTADPDGLMASLEAAEAQTPTEGTWQGTLGAEANDGALESAYSPFVRFVSTAANLDTVDEGTLHVRLYGYKVDNG